MSNKPLVVVSHALPTRWVQKLEEACEVVSGPAVGDGLAEALRPFLAEAAAFFTLLTVSVNDELLDQMPNVRVVSNMAVGVDNVDLNACTRRGIPVGHTPGVLTEGTADLTLALLLAAARRLPEASQDARAGGWTTWSPTGWLGADMAGATVGIVGMGKIGQAVAARAKAFGVNLLYTSRRPKREAEAMLGAQQVALTTLLQQSDFVCLHVPLTSETHHLIDAAALQQMKESAILVNMARGPVVDTAALLQALKAGWIRAAALDVTDPEPLPATHPLYTFPNCLIVPHIGSATENTRRRMAALACDNVLAGLAGQRLPYCVNTAVYEV